MPDLSERETSRGSKYRGKGSLAQRSSAGPWELSWCDPMSLVSWPGSSRSMMRLECSWLRGGGPAIRPTNTVTKLSVVMYSGSQAIKSVLEGPARMVISRRMTNPRGPKKRPALDDVSGLWALT